MVVSLCESVKCVLIMMLVCRGSCGYGYLHPDKGTGWDIIALPDGHYEYKGSCG